MNSKKYLVLVVDGIRAWLHKLVWTKVRGWEALNSNKLGKEIYELLHIDKHNKHYIYDIDKGYYKM